MQQRKRGHFDKTTDGLPRNEIVDVGFIRLRRRVSIYVLLRRRDPAHILGHESQRLFDEGAIAG